MFDWLIVGQVVDQESSKYLEFRCAGKTGKE